MAKAAYTSICGEQGSFQVLGTTTPGLDVSPQAVLRCLCAPHSCQLEKNSHPRLPLWLDPCTPNVPGAAPLILACKTASASAKNAASALQPLPTARMFLKVWIVLPHSCCHVDVLYPGHVGLGAGGAWFGRLLIRRDFPTGLRWDKQWLCRSPRSGVGMPCACPSQWKVSQPWLERFWEGLTSLFLPYGGQRGWEEHLHQGINY